jgi:hypothetical protein
MVSPGRRMKRYATYVVHVTVCDEHVGLANGTVGASPNVQGNLDLRKYDTCLLHTGSLLQNVDVNINLQLTSSCGDRRRK